MRKPHLLVALAALAGILASGCTTLQTATALNQQKLTTDDSSPVAHVHGSNWGIYLFNIVPLLSGDTRIVGSIAVVDDNVNVNAVVDMVTRQSAELKATRTVDLQSHTSGFWLAPTLLLWYKGVEVSGNAVR